MSRHFKLACWSLFIGLALYLAGALIDKNLSVNEWGDLTSGVIGSFMVIGVLILIVKT